MEIRGDFRVPDYGRSQQGETSPQNRAQQMVFMLEMLINVALKEGNQGLADKMKGALQLFAKQAGQTPPPLSSMVDQLNQYTTEIDLRYQANFPLIWPNDPEGQPGVTLLTWMTGYAKFLDPEQKNPAIQNWINQLEQFIGQNGWSASDVYKEVEAFLTAEKSQGLSLPYNFFGNDRPPTLGF